jgi:hypothetical protein
VLAGALAGALADELAVEFMSMGFQEVFQHGMSMLSENRLRVKLNTFNGQTFVAHSHNFTIVGPGCHLQVGRAASTLDGQ